MDILSLELQKLGLKEREVRVYLAGLELGPASVQAIARKSGVTRPTMYEILKMLEGKGLFREAQQGKKRFFIANSPEKILNILRLEKRELEEKEREFIRIIAALESKYTLKERGAIRVFKGKEGLQVLQEQILYTAKKDIVVFTSEKAQVQRWRATLQKRLGKLLVRERIVPGLQGTLFLGDKAIFISTKKQEGYLVDSPLVVDSLKHLF